MVMNADVEAICTSDAETIISQANLLQNIGSKLGIQESLHPLDMCVALSKGGVSAFITETLGVAEEAFIESFKIMVRTTLVEYGRVVLYLVVGPEVAQRVTEALINLAMYMPFVELIGLLVKPEAFGGIYKKVEAILTAPGMQIKENIVMRYSSARIAGEVTTLMSAAGLGTLTKYMSGGALAGDSYAQQTVDMVRHEVGHELPHGYRLTERTMGLLTLSNVYRAAGPIGNALGLIANGGMSRLVGIVLLIVEIVKSIIGMSEITPLNLFYQLLTEARKVIGQAVKGSIELMSKRGHQYILAMLAKAAAMQASGLAFPLYWSIYVLSNVVYKVGLKMVKNVVTRKKKRKYLYAFNRKFPVASPQMISSHMPRGVVVVKRAPMRTTSLAPFSSSRPPSALRTNRLPVASIPFQDNMGYYQGRASF
jgi:hypothetical protein